MIRATLFAATALTLVACGEGREPAAERVPLDLTPAVLDGSAQWIVDRSASTAGFNGTMNGNAFSGSFENFAVAIVLDPEAPETDGAIDAQFDLGSASVPNDSEKTDALPGETWFHIDLHPVATYRSDAITATGPGTYEAQGSLSLKGFSQPVSVPFTLEIGPDGRAVADASVMLNRSDFQVGTGEFAEGKWVSFDVEVVFHIEAVPAG
ncbi:MAG: YceI family protein [Pseudomonadota bacterium]